MSEAKEIAQDPKTEPTSSPLPDVGDLLFIGVMYILLFGRPHFLFQDASIGWHLQAGKFIFETRSIPYTDLFSYTFPDKAWVAYEWLFDLIAYLLTMAGGYNLLAVAVAGFIAMVSTKMYDRTRDSGGGLAIATFASLTAILASAVHWLARPHIVTFLAVSSFVALLDSFQRDQLTRSKLYIYLCLLMLLWVNCHPAFLLGIVLIGAYFAVNLVQTLIQKSSFARCKDLFGAGLLVSATTLLNPYGWNLHIYIFKYLRGSSIIEKTDEFLSPVFHDDIHALCLEILILLFVVGLTISKRKLSAPYLTVTLLFLHLSLSAVRNIPLFALVVTPAIGFLFAENNLKERIRPVSTGFLTRLKASLAEFDAQEKLSRMRILSIGYFLTMAAAALSGGSLFGIVNLDAGFDKTKIPTTTLNYIKEQHLAYDRGFNYDNWGGLLRYDLDQRVFIDDRADFYGEQFYNQYGTVVETRPGWEEILNKHRIDWILMPSNTKLVLALKKEPGWRLAASDAAASLFVRARQEQALENDKTPLKSEDSKNPVSQ